MVEEGHPGTREPWPDLSGIHAFLIGDEDDTRIMIRETLAHYSAVVATYESADTVIAALSECLANVLICDLSMPGLDGVGFVRRLRAQPPERGGLTPTIAIAARYEDLALAATLEVGFNIFMVKPFRLDELCRLVKELSTTGHNGRTGSGQWQPTGPQVAATAERQQGAITEASAGCRRPALAAGTHAVHAVQPAPP